MEIRYQDDCDDILTDRWPIEREYAKKVTDLRKKYWDILGHGIFTDEEHLTNRNPGVVAKGFQKDRALAVVLWNDTKGSEAVCVEAAGFRLKEVSGVHGTGDGLPDRMESQELLIAIYERI